jgi:hypothetical protein
MTTHNGNGAAPPDETRTIVIHDRDGRARTFVSVEEISAAHREWLLEELRAAGLDSPDIDNPDVLYDRAFGSGRVLQLLAGVLVEPGVRWTPALAAANADLFAQISDPEEKAAVWDAMRSFLQVLPLLMRLRHGSA